MLTRQWYLIVQDTRVMRRRAWLWAADRFQTAADFCVRQYRKPKFWRGLDLEE